MLVGALTIVIVACSLAGRARRRCWELAPRSLRVGLALMVAGAAAYLLVRYANGGHVPSTSDALRTAGRSTVDAAGRRVPELTDRRLGLLGNLLAWPAPLPLATVIGAPQIAVLVGLAVALRMPPPEPEVTRIDLDAGRFWWDAAPGGREHLEVRLPGGVLRASTARLGIDLTSHGGVVIVVEGSVTLDQGTSVLTIEEGYGVELGADGRAGEPERLSARDLANDRWVGPHLADVGTRRPLAPIREGRLWPVTAVLAALAVAAMATVTYVAQVATVPSESMVPTLAAGDRVLVAKAVGAPAAPDVIVFERPRSVETGPLLLVKRVVAIGGQTVSIRDGAVLVNGKPIAEPYLPAGVETEPVCGPKGEVEVPAGSLFVLGDNRPDSFDSRCFGPIRLDQVLGTVVRGLVPMSGTP